MRNKLPIRRPVARASSARRVAWNIAACISGALLIAVYANTRAQAEPPQSHGSLPQAELSGEAQWSEGRVRAFAFAAASAAESPARPLALLRISRVQLELPEPSHDFESDTGEISFATCYPFHFIDAMPQRYLVRAATPD